MAPQDICACGDFRSQHRDGHGPCTFNKPLGIGHNGAGNCERFELAGANKRKAQK